MVSPAGFERFFRELSAAESAGGAGPDAYERAWYGERDLYTENATTVGFIPEPGRAVFLAGPSGTPITFSMFACFLDLLPYH